MGCSGVRILVSLVGTISPLKIVLSPVNMTPGTLGTGFGRDWSLTKNKQKLKFILLNKTSYQITTLSQEMYKRKPELITNPGPSCKSGRGVLFFPLNTFMGFWTIDNFHPG